MIAQSTNQCLTSGVYVFDVNSALEIRISPNKELHNTLEITVNLLQPDAKIIITGRLKMADIVNTIDITINHLAPLTKSTVDIKSVVDNTTELDITARITIPRSSTHCTTETNLKGLILNNNSKITLQPYLDIKTNEVVATHAASTGRIDPQQLEYLQQHGLEQTQARNLIINSFL